MTFTKVSHFFSIFTCKKKNTKPVCGLVLVWLLVFVLTLKAGECCFLGLGYLGVRHHCYPCSAFEFQFALLA